MRVLVAPDKLKGSLTSAQAATAIAEGVLRVYPDAEVTESPIADGGEGTLDAALRAGYKRQVTTVTGPLGDPVDAEWALHARPGGHTTAIIESAKASGLELMKASPANALDAHSYGTGQLIAAAMDVGATEIVVGLGGSAMTDGGIGAIRALGLRARDTRGNEIDRSGGRALLDVAALDATHLDSRLAHVTIRLAVDVLNPLHGNEGAAYVFAPQKGADQVSAELLEKGLRNWAIHLDGSSGRICNVPGAGAAGGFAAPFLAFTNATLESGYTLVAEMTGLADQLSQMDLVITGEGSMDSQSLQGKAPIALARAAAMRGIPVTVMAGRILIEPTELERHGVTASAQILDLAQWASGEPDASDAMANAALYLRTATAQTLAAGSVLQATPIRSGGTPRIPTVFQAADGASRPRF